MNARWLVIWIMLVAGPAAAAEPCPEIEGIKPLLGSGTVLLLGELHGTMESPRFTLDVACHAAHSGLPVVVGLELPPEEQKRADAFLDSTGAEQDRSALLAGPRWQGSYQDGRTSRAMLDLMDGLRRLRSEHLPVGVTLFDAPSTGGGQERERGMARNLAAAAAASPQAMIIVLTGNIHSRITLGSRQSATYEPMGYLLGQLISPASLVALNVAHGGGSAWICAPDCGVTDLKGRHGDRQWAIEIDDATRPAGHTGWYHVGAITASPPARLPLPGPPMQTSQVAPGPPPAPTAPHPPSSSRESADAAGQSPRSGWMGEKPLSAVESRLQGSWQAYDYGSKSRVWTIRFDHRRFQAKVGVDDFYAGRIEVREEKEPAQIDLIIDDCRCSYKGMTSEAIYLWDGESLVLSAPQPGNRRPQRFEETSGQMVRLLRADD